MAVNCDSRKTSHIMWPKLILQQSLSKRRGRSADSPFALERFCPRPELNDGFQRNHHRWWPCDCQLQEDRYKFRPVADVAVDILGVEVHTVAALGEPCSRLIPSRGR